MNEKIKTIFISVVIGVVFSTVAFGFVYSRARSDYTEISQQLESSISRYNDLENTKDELQGTVDELRGELQGERDISTALQAVYDSFEIEYSRIERQYKKQGNILQSLRQSDTDIDGTVSNIENGITDSIGLVNQLREAE